MVMQYEFFQFKETAESVHAKDFHGLQPLTSGMHGCQCSPTTQAHCARSSADTVTP